MVRRFIIEAFIAFIAWSFAVVSVAFQADYPVDSSLEWVLPFIFNLIIFFPVLFLVASIIRSKKRTCRLSVIMYFDMIYIAVMIVSTFLMAEIIRRLS